jgi:hypothetical protein
MHHTVNPTGIGCFAANNTLQRVFRKAFENLLLSNYEDICPPSDRGLKDENLRRFLKSVIDCGAEKPGQLEPALESVPESAKITGFFFGLNRHCLHLIVFFLDDTHQPGRLTIRLENFTRIRNKHLH